MSLNYMAPINNTTGYGITSTNILKSMLKRGVQLSLFPIGGVGVDNQQDKNLLEQELGKVQFAGWDTNGPCLKVWHPHDLATRVGKGKMGALVFFELDTIKPLERTMLNNVDVVFTASKWGKEVLEKSGITSKIVVSPLAVDTEVFKDHNNEPHFKSDAFKFINIGKWEIRKGHDFLLEAFNKAFEETDNVELYMINQNPFLSQQENEIWVNMYRQSKLGKKIMPIARVNTHVELAMLIKDMDCGFFPARAEGWNNEVLEVMALDKPVITTNYSAHTEYCTKDNAFLIDIDKLTTAEDGKFFNGEGQWADLGEKQMDQTVEYLRKVYKEGIKTNPAGVETCKKYTWDNTSTILTTEMENV